MLLHIGNDVMVSLYDIVFILDINTCKKSKTNQAFIDKATDGSRRETQQDKNSKSLVVMMKNGKTALYYSPISSITLRKRAENFLNDYTLA